MGIIIRNALVEAHHFIGMVKYYYRSLKHVYSIFIIEIPGIKSDLALKILFKTINNLVSPNKLVLMLLVFGAYLKIIELDISFSSIN